MQCALLRKEQSWLRVGLAPIKVNDITTAASLITQFALRRYGFIGTKALVRTEREKSKREVKISDSMLIL